MWETTTFLFKVINAKPVGLVIQFSHQEFQLLHAFLCCQVCSIRLTQALATGIVHFRPGDEVSGCVIIIPEQVKVWKKDT